MMILMTYSISKVLIGILLTSITLLILVIAYKKLLAYFGKGNPKKEDYCVLYSLEGEVASGEIEIYFTTETPKSVTIELLNEDFSFNREVTQRDVTQGGHIVRFDSTVLANGHYYYCLRTDNQKTMKKMRVENN